MKKNTSAILICFLFVLFLTHPTLVVSGASEGLLLWFHTVLPTLFPFFVITSLLISSNAFLILSQIFSNVFCKIFCITPPSVIAVLGGFSCGYPMGAKIADDLYAKRLISLNESTYLVSFCNNASPMFIISFFVTQKLGIPKLALPSLLILFSSSVLCSFLFRKIHLSRNPIQNCSSDLQMRPVSCDLLSAFDQAITGSMENIIKIGGYIIFFSILVSFAKKYISETNLFQLFLVPALEITNGLTILADTSLYFWQAYVLMMFHTSFGGICAIFQTKCVAKNLHFSFTIYAIEKLITAIVTSLLSYLYIQIIFLRY